MDATARLDTARTLAAPRPAAAPFARTQAQPDELALRAGELAERLGDALCKSFELGAWEEQVAHHVLLGRSADAIARRLGVRETTVHKHMHRLFAKTNTASRIDLFNLALRLAAHRSILTGSSLRAAA